MIGLHFFITFYGIIISHFLAKFGQKRLINTLVFSPFVFFQFVKLIGISRFFFQYLHEKIIFLYGFCKDINDVSLCQILLLQTQKRLRYDNLRTKLTNHCHSAECKIICPCVIQSMIESKLKEVNCHISVVFVSKAIKFGIVIHRLYLYKIRIKILSFHVRPNRY